MKVNCYALPGKQKSLDICTAFAEGCGGTLITDNHYRPGPAMFYGVSTKNEHIWRSVRANKDEFWYSDNSYFDAVRTKQFRVTKNRYQHDGQGTSDGKRFARLGIEVEHYRANEGYVLVVPQSDQFMHVVVGYEGEWLEHIAAKLPQEAAVKIRPWSSDKPGLQKTLRADLMGAKHLVTYSSAAAVQAVLAGVRVTCSENCAAYCFSGAMVASDAERWRWASVLADNQFDLAELADGTAWRMLNDR